MTGFADVQQFDSYTSEFLAGLRANGRIQTWGFSQSRLGIATKADAPWQGEDDPLAFARIVDLSLIEHAVAVAAGNETGCALIADGTVQCWGRRYTESYLDDTSSYIPWEVLYLP
ncbi:MAG: hypothetical protein H6744_14790 [Deltaproteobacteria bacterium]|nr:hypothetical protein [Deltaproteobacteria bacterium]